MLRVVGTLTTEIMVDHDVVRIPQRYLTTLHPHSCPLRATGSPSTEVRPPHPTLPTHTHQTHRSHRPAPRRQTLPPVPPARTMARRAGRALRRDHGEGVERQRAVLRAELRGPRDPRLVAAHHAARVLHAAGASSSRVLDDEGLMGGGLVGVVGPALFEYAEEDIVHA